MTKTLLLNNNFQIISFINERKAIKLILKGKVEIISVWKGRKIYSQNHCIDFPATLKMKYYIPLNSTKLTFSRKLVLRRDNYTCCYCNIRYSNKYLTIDHIIPKSMGGENSFTNCVAACTLCNAKKADRTPMQAGMALCKTPTIPTQYLCYFPTEIDWHDDWLFFVKH